MARRAQRLTPAGDFDYGAEALPFDAERPGMPRIERIAAARGEDVEVLAPPIPHDCVDGFIEGERTGAHPRKGERVRASFPRDLRRRPEYIGSLRLITTR